MLEFLDDYGAVIVTVGSTVAYAAFSGFKGWVRSRAESDPEVNNWDHFSAALKNIVWPFPGGKK